MSRTAKQAYEREQSARRGRLEFEAEVRQWQAEARMQAIGQAVAVMRRRRRIQAWAMGAACVLTVAALSGLVAWALVEVMR